MNIDTRKINFVKEFLQIHNEEVITNFEKLLHRAKVGINNDEFKPMSLEKFNADIDQSLLDAKSGKTVTAKDLKNKIAKWI